MAGRPHGVLSVGHVTVLLAFGLGLLTAGAWVVYIRAVHDKRPGRAALSDLAILLAGSGGVQLWAFAGESFWLFAAFDVGAAAGTYLLVARGVK